jgi:hypothetical protein
MRISGALANDTALGVPLAAAAVLAVAFAVSPPLPARAANVKPPSVPAILEVTDGKPFLVGHAVGTQNYVCLPSASGFSWMLFGPQATLFDDQDKQVATHFLSRNPDEAGLPRATWQHSRDTSTIWAVAIQIYTEPDFVAPGAIPWLLLDVVGAEDGTGAGKLFPTTFIQRINTSDGIAPTTGCSAPADVGQRALVPYTADYIFYKVPPRGNDGD